MEQVISNAELRQNGLGDLAVLHDHLMSYISFLLDLEDVIRLSCCSRLLRVFACEEPLWLGLCLKQQEGVVQYKANWRQTALATYGGKPVPPSAVEAAARPLPPLPGLSSLFLYKRWYRCHVDLSSFLPPPGAPTVDRVNAAGMAPEEFVQRYDRPGLPVLLGGLMGGWPVSCWALPQLAAAFPASLFKVSKPHGGRALMTLSDYADYMARQADEEPLYVFDADFVEAAPGIRKMYDVPHVFTQDYFSELQSARPHFRWLVLGPARAGASWHVDPSLTSAWNSLLSGRKRWALYPPHVRPPGVALDDDGEEAHTSDDGLTSLQWFLEVYPALPPERRPVELVQRPGEVVFVPGGWWHCVLNLETSVAVTQNYVGEANMERVVRYMSYGSSAYHTRPADFYDPRIEVAAWAAKYPLLVPDPDSESDSDLEEVLYPTDGSKAAAEEEEEEAAEQRRRRRKHGSPQPQADGKQQGPGAGAAADVRKFDGDDGDERGKGGARAAKRLKRGSGDGGRGEAGLAPAAEAAGGAGRPKGPGVRGLFSRIVATDPGSGCGAGRAPGGTMGTDDASVAAATATHVHGAGAGAGAGARAAAAVGADGGGGGEAHSVQWVSELAYEQVAVWRRERVLGRWLRRLWGSHPATRATIQDCLFRHLYGGFWRDVLRVIATQMGSARRPLAPLEAATLEPLDLIPLTGADALVFLYGGTAIKIFVHEVPAIRGLMCALEARVPLLLLPGRPAAAAADGGGPDTTAAADAAAATATARLPQPLAWGALAAALTRGKKGEAEAGGSDGQQRLVYVVQQQLQGARILQELLDQGLALCHLTAAAEALGDLIGAVHATAAAAAAAAGAAATAAAAAPMALPPPAAAAAAAATGPGCAPLQDDVEGWDAVLRDGRHAVWHDRYHGIWVSELGYVSSAATLGVEDDDDGNEDQEGKDEDGRTKEKGVGAAAAAGGGDGSWLCDVPVGSRWWPFVQHLRRRRRGLLRGLSDLAIPDWVREQLPAYLPEDPALLLGFTPKRAAAGGQAAAAGGASGPVVDPLLLHGDVTAHNVVVAAVPDGGDVEWRPELSLVDFSDAGHGDPLYELLPVLGSCLRCDTRAVAAFWARYCAHNDPQATWPRRPPAAAHDGVGGGEGDLRLSYCAMCYCLLHEEAELLLQRVWQAEDPAVIAVAAAATAAVAADGPVAAVAAAGKGSLATSPPAVARRAIVRAAGAASPSPRTLRSLATRLWGFLDGGFGAERSC